MIGVLRDKFDVTVALDGQSSLSDTGLDSLDVINFLYTLEEETSVSIPDEDIAEFNLETLNEFAEYIDKRRS